MEIEETDKLNISRRDIFNSYKKFKHHLYYDSYALFFKNQLAEYEIEIDTNLENLYKRIHFEKQKFDELIEDISSYKTPKNIVKENIGYITNIMPDDDYTVNKINYYINCHIDLHLISVLWMLKVAPYLENEISKVNYAYRLELDDNTNKIVEGLRLYKPYYKQYQSWRDRAISMAKKNLDENIDVAIVSLDVKDYFYSVNINILKCVKEKISSDSDNYREIIFLTELLHKCHLKYTKVISDERNITAKSDYTILPIGLPSSGIIGNYYLTDFDNNIKGKLNPIYYGRYVDDILIVITNPKSYYGRISPIHTFIHEYFIKNELLFYPDNDKFEIEENIYKLKTELSNKEGFKEKILNVKYSIKIPKGNNELFVQSDKLILQHFDHRESRAAINIFVKNIERNRSEFRFLPEEENVNTEFDEEAFGLYYTDSVNKIRSVKELSEDKYGASKYLAKKIYSSLFSKGDVNDESIKQILTFFKGRIGLSFHQLWEKVSTYFILNKKCVELEVFFHNTIEAINKIQFDKDNTEYKSIEDDSIKEQMIEYLKLSVSIPLALNLNFFEGYSFRNMHLTRYINEIRSYADLIRKANLMRHSLVMVPSANYFNEGKVKNKLDNFLGKIQINSSEINEISDVYNSKSLLLSPRFVHFHEVTQFLINFIVENSDSREKKISITLDNYLEESFKIFTIINYYWREELDIDKEFSFKIDFKSNILKDKYQKYYYRFNGNNKNYNEYVLKSKDEKSKIIKVSLANVQVFENNMLNSILNKPNVSLERRNNLFKLLNKFEKESSDFFVMPETSIPHSWLRLLVELSHKRRIGIVAGLEHWVNSNAEAFNFIVTILPMKVNGYYSTFIKVRLKNHYSHEENETLRGYRLSKPNNPSEKKYDLFNWNGVNFSVFNCFELANITDRSLFKSKVDFMVASEYNKDVNYFSNIVEASCRDIHCYFIQVNNSKWGDSRITQPSKTESKDIMKLKGGDNENVNTGVINIDKLRNFQLKEYNLQKNTKDFKPTPPDFDIEEVKKRLGYK
jgi:hypothetical protein